MTLVEGLPPARHADAEAARLVGMAVGSLSGGEPGLLAHTVRLAALNGAGGQLPFAAVVVQHGIVIGAGVNTALADRDVTAHAEVAAIRDTTRRTRRLDVDGAVVYSSCEPCAICRTVAAAAGVSEIVFAAAANLVPAAIDPSPHRTAALSAAVSEHLPGIARPGHSGLDATQLSAPFEAYAKAVTG